MPVLPNPDYLSHPKFRPMAERISEQTRITALNQFLPALNRAYSDWTDAQRPNFDARIGAGDEALAELQRSGVSLLRIDADAKAALTKLTEPHFGPLRSRLEVVSKPKFRDMNAPLDRAKDPGIYAAVEAIFGQLHVFDIAGAYVRQPLRIKKLFVQLNNEQETGARYGAIDERGLPGLKTDYWHIDSDVWPSVKVLVYLNDVDLDHDPLRYVGGSHREVPDFETLVRKTNDSLKLPTDQFLSLPDELRMHALFGPYLAGDEPKALEMLGRERAQCGGGADLILFDNNGVHRGGFVRSGERQLLQCLFEAP